ncbi:MAG: GAF domain-containing protein [Vicinamibacteria bacterium]|nr:GAF domain-containing protein [Vicinamibacteria bacterium]
MRARATHCYDPHVMVEDPQRLQAPYEARVRELSERLEQRERELSVLAEVAIEVHSTESAQSVFEIALDKVREKLGLSAAWILTGEENDQQLHLAAARGVSQRYIEEVRRSGSSDCLCREVFWSGHTMQARNTTQCPRMPAMIEGSSVSGGHACIPLFFRGGSRGVLNVAAPAGRPFSEGELRFLETLGHQISLAVERARRGEAERQRHDEARTAYRELRAAQERIIETEKMALLGTFAAGLAHEIRNPLNSIALQLSVIERRNARLETDLGIGELIGIIREEVSRLDALAGDFLQFSRADRVQQGFADLNLVIEHVLRLLEPHSAACDVRLVYQPPSDLPPLPIDAEKMKQVMINLVRNGVEAMTGGGLVTVKVVLNPESVQLSVEDTGPGLPDDVDVFQIFTTTKPGGTGLGLSIARQIIASHGGAITARNAPGGGALFEITLPIAPRDLP